MSKKATAFIALLAFTAWLYPIKAVSSFDEPKNQIASQEAQTSNFPINKEAKNVQPQEHPQSVQKEKPRQPKVAQAGSSGTPDRRYSTSQEEVIQLIKNYSAQYEINADLPLAIARCESGFNANAKNRNSSASGVFQWLSSSWRNQPASQNGAVSVFNADANVSAAVWLIAHGKTSGWNASKSCWAS